MLDNDSGKSRMLPIRDIVEKWYFSLAAKEAHYSVDLTGL